jgi:signal transduction histidine kinase
MSLLQNVPVRQKLVIIILLVTGSNVLFATVALALFDFFRFRNEILRDLESVAEMVAENSTAALSFQDPVVAKETLATLSAKPRVASACIYDAAGEIFAEYRRSDDHESFPSMPQHDGVHMSRNALAVSRGIQLSNKRIGMVYAKSDLRELNGRLKVQASSVTLVLVGCGLLTLFLSSGLQRVISAPILHLAATAKSVSKNKDYSARATKFGSDELGQLVDAFNEMLTEIEDKDAKLRHSNEVLEERVIERTRQLQIELTERQKSEQELQVKNIELAKSNQELDDFSYIASHDLKEPLRGIHNYSMFLLEDYGNILDVEGKSKLETLARLSRHMEALIDSLLYYSRVGRVDLAIGDVDLQETVAQVLDSLSISLKEAGCEVRIPVPLPIVRCDRARVAEVFRNLISNAIKYNDRAEKWVEIGAISPNGTGRSSSKPQVLYVRDNGIGIAERHFESIFRIFKRLNSRDKFGGGTGAGLTIVKKIIERQQGKIWLESVQGEGTTFYFTLEEGST